MIIQTWSKRFMKIFEAKKKVDKVTESWFWHAHLRCHSYFFFWTDKSLSKLVLSDIGRILNKPVYRDLTLVSFTSKIFNVSLQVQKLSLNEIHIQILRRISRDARAQPIWRWKVSMHIGNIKWLTQVNRDSRALFIWQNTISLHAEHKVINLD